MNPWLPEGFSFLSGLPEGIRKRRLLVPIQALIDESGGKGHSKMVAFAGWIS